MPSGKVEQPLSFVLRMADVIAMWQDGTATFILKDGRCYCHVADGIATLYIVMADVNAKWQMELPLRVDDGTWLDVITKLADGIAIGLFFPFYVNFSSEMLCRTSPQMCGRWYVPMFLFRDGLLTLM